MLGTYSYHQIIRKTIIGFGTLFNNIEIRHQDENGSDYSFMKVPLAYGPIQKFLARIEQQPDLSKKPSITLPRMAFEMVGLQYDPARKGTVAKSYIAKSPTNTTGATKVYLPVPYNLTFELSIIAKINDDVLQIVEQILPNFQPALNFTINLIDSIGEKRDVPVVLDGIRMQDDYETDFNSRRTIIWTLTFTSKVNLFGAIADSTDGLIKKVQVDYMSGTNTNTARREVRYTATPKALEDYNGDLVVDSNDDALVEYGDDFGFNETISFFQDMKAYSASQGTDVVM